MKKSDSILVAGMRTMVGSAIFERLGQLGYPNIFPENPGRDVDWTNPRDVLQLFRRAKPDYVFVAAGLSEGIVGNMKHPASLMLNNLSISMNVIDAARQSGVDKLLYLASSCCYPRDCPQPMKPDYLMTGPIEPTNESYSSAKIAGIKLCEAFRKQYGCNFIVGIPSNPFGPNHDVSVEDTHVIQALIVKMHDAKLRRAPAVQIWGTGSPRRDFVYSLDLADACVFVMNRYNDVDPINLGVNQDISIAELASKIQAVVGYKGTLHYDIAKPDGMPRKCLDASHLAGLGWRSSWPFEKSLNASYKRYLSQLRLKAGKRSS